MNSTTTRLLIARHGNTFGPGDRVKRVGTTDLPLVNSGLLQGQKLGAYLKQKHLIPDVIFTSQLKRAIQTADQAQGSMQTQLPINTLSMFNEIDYGPDENQLEEQVVARVGTEALKAWERDAKVPDGWNVDPKEIIAQWQDFSDRLEQDFVGKTILVVTSNGIARFAPYLTGDFIGFTQKYSIKISTGALCVLAKNSSSEGWACLQWNVTP